MPEEKSTTIEPTQPPKDPKSFEGHAAPRKKSKRTTRTAAAKPGAHAKGK